MRKILIILLSFLYLGLNAQDIGGDYYVSPTGDDSRPGTYAEPFATLQQAIIAAYPGDTVYIRGGVYYPLTSTSIDPPLQGRTGTASDPICYFNYPGETPILDYSLAPRQAYLAGISITEVQYIKFKGITVRNVWQKGNTGAYVSVQGIATSWAANLTFDNMTVHSIAGRGYGYSSGAWNSWDAELANHENPVYALWDHDTTRFTNCDAYDLCDTLNYFVYPAGYEYQGWAEGDTSWRPGNSADGWKTSSYEGNVLILDGCRAWNYSDDGFDLSGAGIDARNSWAMSTLKYEYICGQGTPSWKSVAEEWYYSSMEGNGFKTSGFSDTLINQNTPMVYVTNCISAFCKQLSFIANIQQIVDQSSASFRNNLSYKNDMGFSDSPYLDIRKTTYYNNLSFANRSAVYAQTAIYSPSIYTESNNSWVATQSVDGYPGWILNPAFTVSAADFVNLDSATIVSELTAPRKTDGSLPDITVFRLAVGSDLIGAGTNVGMSATPDIGIDWAYLDSQSSPDSTANDITSFTISGQTGNSTINFTNHTVAVTMPYNTNRASLTPTISVSQLATINPTSGTARNFTSPITYIVTSGNVTAQLWTVTVNLGSVPPVGRKVGMSNGRLSVSGNGHILYLP